MPRINKQDLIVKHTLLSLLLHLSATIVLSQNTTFFSANLLSGAIINTITQDKQGLLWIGTHHGLDSFDGYTFQHHDTFQTDEPRAPQVTSLLSDNSGQLWVGTARGLFQYQPATDQFLPVSFTLPTEPRVTSLIELSDERLIAGTAGYGCFHIDRQTLTAEHVNQFAPPDDNDYFSLICQTRNGHIWKAGINDQLVCANREGKLSTHHTGCGMPVCFLQREDTTYVLCQRGLIRLDSLRTRLLTSSTSHFTCGVMNEKGDVFIGTRGEGLFYIPHGDCQLKRLPLLTTGVDVTKATIETLFIDRQGNLWAGCQQKGLLLIPLDHQPLFQTWSFAAQRIETASSVSSISAGDNCVVWCTVPGNGVYAFNKDGFVVAHPAAPQHVETMLRDRDGRYWIGTSEGLFSYEPEKGSFELIVELPGERVNLLTDLTHELVAVSTYGEGLCIVNKLSGRVVRHLTMNDNDTDNNGRLANNWIYTMDTDAQGRLWIGTSSGVSCYDPNSGSFKTEGWLVLAEQEACTALRVLSSGDVLLGLESGLYRWHHGQQLCEESGTERLRGRAISFIAEDGKGDVWVSTNDGIWQWTPDSQMLVPYIGANGLKTREFVQGAGLLTKDGQLLLGTADGVTLFDPDSLRQRQPSTAKVHLTAFVVDEQPANIQTLSNGQKVMDSALHECRHFCLSYLDANFHLEFSLLSFHDAADVSFEYRFKGETRWQTTGRGSNIVAFNHLAPGNYELEVRALQACTYSPSVTYFIKVLPPWWRSPFAYFIYILLFIAALLMLIILYNRHVQHQYNREKLHLLMTAINADDTPLTLDDMKRAINSFVQSRKRKRGLYGDVEAMTDRVELPEQRGNDEALMDRIMQSINLHLGDSEFTVEQLCAEAAISRAHLHRKMKEMTGLPITEFIRNIRLEQAARLLREQKLNITQVAYTVGFSNLGYFSTVFRKHFGVAPRDFVAQHCL